MTYESHPNGVAPEGNLYFSSERSIRQSSLGFFFNRLSDGIIQDILSYCTGQDLSRLVIVSKILYCYANFSDLWRDITLRKFNGKDIKYRYTWKDTYYYNIILYRNNNANSFTYHKPLKIKGVYSNYLHQSWLCHTFDFDTTCPGFLLERPQSEIAVISRHDLTTNEFIVNYEIPNIPIVIKDVCDCHFNKYNNTNHTIISNSSNNDNSTNKHTCESCLTVKWSNAYLSEQFGHSVKLRATSATAPVPAYFTIDEYFQYARQAKEEAPLYLFERNFTMLAPTLQADYQIPAYFSYDSYLTHQSQPSNNDNFTTNNSNSDNNRSSSTNRSTNTKTTTTTNINKSVEGGVPYYDTDLFRLLGENKRPDYRWLIAGPARSGSIFHIDPNQTNAWNLCIRGRKKWIFYPPDVTPPGIKCSPDGAEVAIPISIGEWLLTFWKYHLEAREHKDPKKRPLEIILYPGQVIFVPHGWWHMVINLDESIALTYNYVSTSNLSDVLNFLREKQDQISGIRDRSNEGALNPKEIYDIFIMKLKEIYRKDIIDKFIYDSQISSLLSNNTNTTISSSNNIEQHTNLPSQQICANIAKRSKYNNTIITSKKNKRKKLTTNNTIKTSFNINQTSSEIINTICEDESFTFGFIINSNENN